MNVLPDAKRAARERAHAARAEAHADAHAGGAAAALSAASLAMELLGEADPGTVSAYLAIRSEIDALPLMMALAARGVRIALPVIVRAGEPLVFRSWTPGAPLEPGPFGTSVPRDGAPVEPDVLFAPLLAFDARCHRLGYGGGFYDRTLAGLRSRRPIRAFGFAYARQQLPEVPADATDVRLDAVVTEAGVIWPSDGPTG